MAKNIPRKKLLSIVITGYNEEKSIPSLYSKLAAISQKISKYQFEIIYVDNNSTDNSEKVLRQIIAKDKRVRLVIMSRNFGSPQPSYVAGLTFARGAATILLHGDIQDPPELIPAFVKKWEEGYDVVYGIIKKREGMGMIMNFWYRLFYFLYQKLSPIPLPRDSSDFSLIDEKIKKIILEFPEKDFIFRGIRSFVGFSQIGIPYKRNPRRHGISKENFFSNIWWAKTIIFTFSAKPLAYVTRFFVLLFLITFAFLIVLLIRFLYEGTVDSTSLLIFIVILSTLANFFALSLISEYLSRIFVEIKGRPRYIIRKKYNVK